jgi:SAM-dependent methyltransferase
MHNKTPAMNNADRLKLIRASTATLAISETVKAALLNILVRVLTYHPTKDNSFDKRYKTDTTGTVPQRDLGISDERARRAAVLYVSAPVKFEEHVLGTLEIDYKDFDFVDLGCGKGRVLLLAAALPFRSVRGVEISQELCAIARKNLCIYPSARKQCRKIDVECMDAILFPISGQNTVFHFYHPFNTDVLRPVLGNIATAFRVSKKQVRIVYIWEHLPDLFPIFEEIGFKRLHHVQTLNPRYQYAVFTM